MLTRRDGGFPLPPPSVTKYVIWYEKCDVVIDMKEPPKRISISVHVWDTGSSGNLEET